MTSTLQLGRGREFDRLRAIYARLGGAGKGLGDDCALIRLGATTLCVSIDLSLQGVHFRADWLTFEEIGWRAAAAALSDLAAEGAKPLGVLVSLGLPATAGDREAAAVMAGIGAAARSVGARVLGGDLVRSELYLVDVCVLGTTRRPVRRNGAKRGHGVWVTGALGGAALALSRYRAGREAAARLTRRYARPEPRVAAGLWLARHGATAMIDISDGLAADAGHLAAASRVALEIELERIPCWPGVDPRDAVASGEEFELLVTLPRSFRPVGARAFRKATGLGLTRIGTCGPRSGGAVRLTLDGRPVTVPPGFDHFATR